MNIFNDDSSVNKEVGKSPELFRAHRLSGLQYEMLDIREKIRRNAEKNAINSISVLHPDLIAPLPVPVRRDVAQVAGTATANVYSAPFQPYVPAQRPAEAFTAPAPEHIEPATPQVESVPPQAVAPTLPAQGSTHSLNQAPNADERMAAVNRIEEARQKALAAYDAGKQKVIDDAAFQADQHLDKAA
jgi:hypothetical protein